MTYPSTDPPRAARPLVAAGAVFVDDAGRVLLVRPTYKPDWDIPGGYVETGETPRDACRREVYEELGLCLEIGRLLAIDWSPHPDQGDKLLFIFDGGHLNNSQLSSIRFRDGEIAEYAFLNATELDKRLIPRLSNRLRAALAALSNQGTSYLESGNITIDS